MGGCPCFPVEQVKLQEATCWFKVSEVGAQPDLGSGLLALVALAVLPVAIFSGCAVGEAPSPRRFDPSVLAVPMAGGTTDWRPQGVLPASSVWPSQTKDPVSHKWQILPKTYHVNQGL